MTTAKAAKPAPQLLVTKEEAVAHYHQCVQLTAKRLGFSDIEWKGTDELLEELMKKDSMTYRVLLSYLNAYRAWHDYHVWLDANGKVGRLDEHEKSKLRGLITERDAHRKSIISRLDHVAPSA